MPASAHCGGQTSMNSRTQSWTSLLKQEGPDFLAWLHSEQALSTRVDTLATSLSSLLHERVSTPEQARDVWMAAPSVLGRCNGQDTYGSPGASFAYAWLHLLDRYVRTWIALEHLVDSECLPMGKDGIHALDVGAGPGPAAFAMRDFYTAMVEFSKGRANNLWRQPPEVTCIELDLMADQLRAALDEMMIPPGLHDSGDTYAMFHNLQDFGKLEPTRERKAYLQSLRVAEFQCFDNVMGEWYFEQEYSLEEANAIAGSLHRYRLIVFSNFLTSVRTVAYFKRNLVDVLYDANPGTVLLLIGGKGGEYPEIYGCVDELANKTGFEQKVAGLTVSCAENRVAERVHQAGRGFYEHLQGLAKNEDNATKGIRKTFERQERPRFASSEIRAYRKPRYAKRDNKALLLNEGR